MTTDRDRATCDRLAKVMEREWEQWATWEQIADALLPVVAELVREGQAEALEAAAEELLTRQAKAVVRAANHADDADQDAWHRDIGRAAGYGTSAHLARLRAAALRAPRTGDPA